MSVNNEFKLLQFFSVDIIGATALKVTAPGSRVPEWAHRFRTFYKEFPEYFRTAYQNLPTEIPQENRPAEFPQVWKFNGDEILLFVELKKHTDVLSHMLALMEAAKKWRTHPIQEHSKPLGVKLTSWVAGFPIINTEVVIELHNSKTILRDFIGPRVDLGFRLASLADERFIPISVELALMLLDSFTTFSSEELCYLDYLDRRPLKGITNNAPYPLFVVDMEQRKSTPEDRIKINANKRPFDLSRARNFCIEFLKNSEIPRPFIVGELHPDYQNIPEDIQNAYAQICQNENLLKQDDLADVQKPKHTPENIKLKDNENPS